MIYISSLILDITNIQTWISIYLGVVSLIITILGIILTKNLRNQVKQAETAATESKTASLNAENAAKESKTASQSAENAAKESKTAAVETQTNLVRLGKLTNDIADYTRKPLEHIEDILYEIYVMIENAIPKYPLDFLGFTLGLGLAHSHTEVKNRWEAKYKNKEGIPFSDFDNMCEELLEKLNDKIKISHDVNIVCLKQGDCFMLKFLHPLWTERYRTLPENGLEDLCTKIENKHQMIKTSILQNDKLISKKKNVIKEIENIPLQVIKAKIMKDGTPKDAVIVFHIGTENVGSPQMYGFYSEAHNMCELFGGYVRSIYSKQ